MLAFFKPFFFLSPTFNILILTHATVKRDERETWYIYHYPAPYTHNLLEKDRPQWHTQIIHGNRRPPSTKQEYHSSILWYMDTLIWKCEIGAPLKNLPKTFLPPS